MKRKRLSVEQITPVLSRGRWLLSCGTKSVHHVGVVARSANRGVVRAGQPPQPNSQAPWLNGIGTGLGSAADFHRGLLCPWMGLLDRAAWEVRTVTATVASPHHRLYCTYARSEAERGRTKRMGAAKQLCARRLTIPQRASRGTPRRQRPFSSAGGESRHRAHPGSTSILRPRRRSVWLNQVGCLGRRGLPPRPIANDPHWGICSRSHPKLM